MNTKQILLQMKFARIIEAIAKRQNISIELAMDRFYHSTTFQLINNGVSDLHCNSDEYLVEEFCLEWEKKI
ncbi:MAG: DUF3791 domain-containing protein [Bacteroidales bacterium]|nr:DUF3791 domain-containing protein [Bacteroidales bacterium]